MQLGLSIRLFTPGSGGLQHHAARLLENLRELDHRSRVITRAVSHTPSSRDYFEFSEPYHVVGPPGFDVRILRHSKAAIPLLTLSRKACGRERTRRVGISAYTSVYGPKMTKALAGCDLVHHVGQGTEMIGFAAAIAARRLRIPFLIQPTIHPGQWGDHPIDFLLYRQADRLLVHTNFERDYFLKRGFQQPIDVVGNGIDDRENGDSGRFRQKYQISGPFILFLGRKDKDKGYHLLLEAFADVRKRHSDATLVCIGPGPCGTGPSTESSHAGIVELPFVDEQTKHDALAACTILCVPSEAESFGLVFMEAARYAKPIIARDIPVLAELFGNEGAVLLGERHDLSSNCVELKPSVLSDAIVDLMDNESRRVLLGHGAKRASQPFLWKSIAQRFANVYDEARRKCRA